MRALCALVVLAACGDGVPGPDASTAPDANVGLVRVRYPGHRDAEVFFQNADGSMALATRVDSAGEANAYMAPGGFVTIANREAFNTTLFTWAGVEGGDELELLRDAPGLDPLTIFLAIPPDDPSTFFYQLASPCNGTSINGAEVEVISVELENCPSSTIGMLVEAFGNNTRYLFRDAVAIEHGGFIELEGPYLNLEPLLVHALNVPAEVSLPRARAALVSGRSELFVADDFTQGPTSPGTFNAALPMPLPATGTLAWQVRADLTSQFGAISAIAWGPMRHDVTVDFGVPLRRYTSAAHYVPSEHAIRWTEDTTGRAAHGVIVSFNWNRDFTGENLIWRMVSPRSEEPVVRFPVLPFADLMPGPGDVVFAPGVLTSFIAAGGYASARAYGLDVFDTFNTVTWPVRGPSGQVVVQTLGQ